MRLCLDEAYSPQIAEDLRAAGFDVISVKERPDLEGSSDADLLSAMTVERRALLTENVGDFAPLLQQLAATGESHYGVIYSAPRSMPRSAATIGMYVRALTELLRRFSGEKDFRDAVAWLQPPE